MSSTKEKQRPNVLMEVKGLKKHFEVKKGYFKKQISHVKAVDGVDVSIYEGETLGIVGESGCGKSTTGEMLLGLLKPSEGSVKFMGKDITNMSKKELRDIRKDIQVIFQDPFASLNPRMTVEELIGEPLEIHTSMSNSEIRNKVIELLEVVGLNSEQIKRYPHEFSGGQRQRIGIARALALNPKMIICDEPVSALDVSIQAQILNLLKKLQREYNLTLVFIAHGLPAIRNISDRIAVMYLGKIVEITDRDQLFNEPMHPYTEALLKSIPIDHPKRRSDYEPLKGDLPNPANPPSGCAFHTRCPYVQDICKSERPKLEENKENHFAACHFPLTK